jgi:hypothetical protein|uniref:hypothetical protein n=1 Tax=Cephaloticoccus sp. TaxID=1985742 RepID=UPI00404B5CBC
MRLRHASLTALFGCLLITGCRKAEVTSYRVPKEAPPAMPGMGSTDMASTAVTTAQGHDLEWQAPSNWVAQPASAMRRGSYRITSNDGHSAELSITAFPGDVGGDLANINRWRDQLQLTPLSPAELPGAYTVTQTGEFDFKLVDLTNPDATEPQQTLAAFITFEGNTWFFKLTGAVGVVTAEKPAFLEFLKTVKGHVH